MRTKMENNLWLLEGEFSKKLCISQEISIKDEEKRKLSQSVCVKNGVFFDIDEFVSSRMETESKSIAIVPIHGFLERKLSFWGWLFGGTSTEMLGKVIGDLVNDDSIDRIVLDIDSPGGEVDGTSELAELIYESREKKEIVSCVNTLAASAAYWIGSSAQEMTIASKTAQAGSIGVVITHTDYSEYDKKKGIKTTEVTAGAYKRIVSSNKPLDDEGRKELQARADYIYGIFTDAVAKNRGVSKEKVLNEMADGRIFMGQQAIDAGLVDKFGKLETYLEVEEMPNEAENMFKLTEITADFLKTNCSSVYTEIFNAGKKDGISAESKRIADIKALSSPGMEKIVEEAIANPETTPEKAAYNIAMAVKDRGASMSDLKRDKDVSSNSASVDDDDIEVEAKERKAARENMLAGANKRIGS
jgi:signal peptide peptidase SppA